MGSIIDKMRTQGKIKPPTWIPGNVMYETIMGSTAYGCNTLTSDWEVGDTLIRNDRNLADSRVVEVNRLTKTRIIAGGNRYRKSDGRTVGGTWSSHWVTIPKEGEIEKIFKVRRHRQLIYEINDACQINKLRDMSLDTLRKLNEVLETP